ncbi:MAG: homocysteine S-methyltransferase [Saprospiraceae bacterium]
MNPFTPFLKKAGVVILDGALATELERRGANLNDPLWSAKMLLEDPSLIQQVHLDYLLAGADVITTASYQATYEGLQRRGFGPREAEAVFEKSVALACQARDVFWAKPANRTGRCKPLVAMSIGPYGAYLADGSEYSGDYGLSKTELMAFHQPRLDLLAKTGGDLLAFETIPSLLEAEALVEVLQKMSGQRAWLSFSCRNEAETSFGDPVESCIRMADAAAQIVAVGFNCTAPEHIGELIKRSAPLTDKPLLAYPNSGEKWDARHHCWLPGTSQQKLAHNALEWVKEGASIVGGCCRTGPIDIAELARLLKSGLTEPIRHS